MVIGRTDQVGCMFYLLVFEKFVYSFFFFFFSSRRRHTRLTCDWSSDVCSSDLPWGTFSPREPGRSSYGLELREPVQVRSEERRVGKSVDLGGRRIIKKKKKWRRQQEYMTLY